MSTQLQILTPTVNPHVHTLFQHARCSCILVLVRICCSGRRPKVSISTSHRNAPSPIRGTQFPNLSYINHVTIISIIQHSSSTHNHSPSSDPAGPSATPLHPNSSIPAPTHPHLPSSRYLTHAFSLFLVRHPPSMPYPPHQTPVCFSMHTKRQSM